VNWALINYFQFAKVPLPILDLSWFYHPRISESAEHSQLHRRDDRPFLRHLA